MKAEEGTSQEALLLLDKPYIWEELTRQSLGTKRAVRGHLASSFVQIFLHGEISFVLSYVNYSVFTLALVVLGFFLASLRCLTSPSGIVLFQSQFLTLRPIAPATHTPPQSPATADLPSVMAGFST